jgi:hypothetical protein
MMLLILKLVNQPEALLLTSPTVVAGMETFVIDAEMMSSGEDAAPSGDGDGHATGRYSKRKFFALVNFLRILQKLAKYNHHRCALLNKYSTPVRSSAFAFVLISCILA